MEMEGLMTSQMRIKGEQTRGLFQLENTIFRPIRQPIHQRMAIGTGMIGTNTKRMMVTAGNRGRQTSTRGKGGHGVTGLEDSRRGVRRRPTVEPISTFMAAKLQAQRGVLTSVVMMWIFLMTFGKISVVNRCGSRSTIRVLAPKAVTSAKIGKAILGNEQASEHLGCMDSSFHSARCGLHVYS